MRKTGFVAIVGRSNAGKSTLLNSLIRQKVSIVSPKPQTTRDNILGIWTDEDSQIVFVDTPGELTARNALGEYMVRNISEAIVDVDCVMLVLDGHNGIGDIELSLVKKYATGKIPLVVVVSKIDISQPEKIMPTLVKLNECQGIAEVYCVSAKKNKGIDELKTALKKYLKGTELYFEEDDVTDKPARFLVCETIREKALLLLEDEVPYGIGVALNKMEFNEETHEWDIDANILVNKSAHKGIILGKGGSMIKEIGTSARISMEKMLESKVYLSLWIKVKEDWRDSQFILNELGYSNK